MVLSVPVLIRAHVGFLAGLLCMLKLRYLPSGLPSAESAGSNNGGTTASAGSALSGRPLKRGSNRGGKVRQQKYLR